MAGEFRQAGHQVVTDASQADLVVINTCAVTSAASSDSRQKIRQAARAGHARIVPTGCWATIDRQGALSMVGVEKVILNDSKDNLVQELIGDQILNSCQQVFSQKTTIGYRKHTRANIKVQDGCDNHCSYCITRIARGRSRSRDLNIILMDIRKAVEVGVKEVVLTGAQLGSWGRDLNPSSNLTSLIYTILDKTTIARLRLSSLEPWEIREDFFRLFDNPRFCQHLHIPLQSGSVSVLNRMGRPMNPDKFGMLVETIRKHNPNIAVTTDLIVGFPGESEIEFLTTLDFVKRIHFAGGHVFHFSPRPQTTAASMPYQIQSFEMKKRSKIIRNVLDESSYLFRQSQKDRTLQILWEKSIAFGIDGYQMEGLSDNYLRVKAISINNLWNQISSVGILDFGEKIVKGIILPSV